ncbi:hypothetical protein CY35_12G090300 [Sphagnum magellanicum]|nr:hypothetical protein CY35_12G090300 [Sphagnum magellanicum]KAH9546336.1 hypothetical protein CY35_12G090300 [Sphagnum magellanicum]
MAAMALGTVQVNKFSWNKKLTKYVKDGQPEEVMQLFQQMQQEGMNPDKFTFVQEINASAGLGALEDGRLVNEQLIQRQLGSLASSGERWISVNKVTVHFSCDSALL